MMTIPMIPYLAWKVENFVIWRNVFESANVSRRVSEIRNVQYSKAYQNISIYMV